MSLSSALATAMSGLRSNQAALSITSSNIANAQTPNYITRTVNQVEVSTGDTGASVLVTGINRQLNQFIQNQLRSETSGGAYANQMASVLNQLQSVYGTPGGSGTLEDAFSNFTTALQSLQTNSNSSSAQSLAASSAQALAQQLNSTTQGIQALRTNAEQDLGVSVNQANADLSQIANINGQLQAMSPTDPAAATLMDQRDKAIDQLSQLMDISVSTNSNNQMTVYTTNGIELVGLQATQLSFNAQGALNANMQWNADPTKSSVGTITATLPNGAKIDLVAANAINSGQIAADLNLRDKVLVQAQTQVDQLAATMASALSDKTTAGTAAPVGPPQAGFDLNTSNMLSGNTINLTYTDKATNTQRQITIVNDPSGVALPSTGLGANSQVIGVDLTGGITTSVLSQLNTAFPGLTFSKVGTSTLQVVDNGATTALTQASVTTTATSLASGDLQLPVFTDGTSPYTGAITQAGSQLTGFAGRITVNPALLADPSKFVVYNTSPQTAIGDTSRLDFLYSQLTSGTFTYSPQTGLGSNAAPLKGTLTNYMQQFLSQQANASTNATQLQQGQSVVVNALQQKLSAESGVNIDTEMANLISLQNTYAANAHVMSVVQTMMTSLLQSV